MKFLPVIFCCLFCLWSAAAQQSVDKLRVAPAPAAKAEEKEDPAYQEYLKLIEADEAALQEVEKMVKDFQAFEAQGAAGSRAVLSAKIDQRLEPVRKSYDDFLRRHPNHVEARLAYGSFLNELDEEEEAITQWEKAREIDPRNPSAWNNLANIFGHVGPVKKALQYYEKAIELDPKEPVYIHNLATTVYLFRKDAAEMYRIDEKGVFDKALDLYRQAMKLDPTNLVLATDFAQSYYGIRPVRTEEARASWNHALTLAKNDLEREGIYLHLARVELNWGNQESAQKHLNNIKHTDLQEMKNRLQRNLDQKRSGAPAAAQKSEAQELEKK